MKVLFCIVKTFFTLLKNLGFTKISFYNDFYFQFDRPRMCLELNFLPIASNIRDPVFVKWLVGWNVIFVITLSNLLKAALKVSLQFISQRFHRSVTFKNILIFLTQNAVSFCCDIFGKLTDNSLCVLLRNKALSLLVMQKKTFFFKDR